jgi:hypothetical protein
MSVMREDLLAQPPPPAVRVSPPRFVASADRITPEPTRSVLAVGVRGVSRPTRSNAMPGRWRWRKKYGSRTGTSVLESTGSLLLLAVLRIASGDGAS